MDSSNQIVQELLKLYSYLEEVNLITVVFRTFLAICAGIFVGIDRSKKHRVAGYKTHTVVCVGAALVMMTGEYVFSKYGRTGDVARLGAQVISGVGFLGVGTIIVTGHNQVQGLTTAASLWTCSCIGLAIGIGFYSGAIVAAVAIIIVMKYLSIVGKYVDKHIKVMELYVEIESNRYISNFLEEAKKELLNIHSINISKPRVKGDGVAALVTVSIQDDKTINEALKIINNIEGINYVEKL